MLHKYVAVAILLSACGRTTLTDDMHVAEDLRPFVEEFFQDCSTTYYKKHCDLARKNIQNIRWGELEDNIAGVYTEETKWRRESNSWKHKVTPSIGIVGNIIISPSTPNVKLTTYHELGHAMGLDHDDESCIMGTYITYKTLETVKQDWDFCVKELFSNKTPSGKIK